MMELRKAVMYMKRLAMKNEFDRPARGDDMCGFGRTRMFDPRAAVPFAELRGRCSASGAAGIFAFLLLAAAASVDAARIRSNAGSTSAAFLKIGVGARAVAMGSAYAAVADDVSSIYWNPAGLANMDRAEITGMHNEWFQGIRYDFLGFGYPLKAGRVFAVAGLALYTGADQERRSSASEDIPEEPLTTSTDKFGAYDIAGIFAYGHRIGRFNLGIAGKLIRQVIDDSGAWGGAVDLGFQARLGRGWLLGGAVQNIGPNITFITKGFKPPMNFKAGIGYRAMRDRLTVALDMNQPVDNFFNAALGAEYKPFDFLALRFGYKQRLYGNELGAASGLSGGLGLAFRGVRFDYAFAPFGVLGNTHRISFGVRFGKTKSAIVLAKAPSAQTAAASADADADTLLAALSQSESAGRQPQPAPAQDVVADARRAAAPADGIVFRTDAERIAAAEDAAREALAPHPAKPPLPPTNAALPARPVPAAPPVPEAAPEPDGGILLTSLPVKARLLRAGQDGKVYRFSALSEMDVRQVEINARCATAEGISVHLGLADAVPFPMAGKVYRYWRLEHNVDPAVVMSVRTDIAVSRAWLEKSGIKAADLKVFRYDGGWQEVPTQVVSQNAGETRLAAFSQKTSVFVLAVPAKK